MLESRMNQVSDQFSRDFNGKATVSYHASQAPRETFISDAGIQGFKTTVKFEQNVQDNLSNLDRQLQKDYKIDHRIFALESNAEAAYKQWKKEQDRIQEQRRGEQAVQEAMERLKQEKEFLKASYISQAAHEEAQVPNFNRDYYYPLAASDLNDANVSKSRYGTQSLGFASPDGKSTAYSNTGSAEKRVTFSKIRMTNNDDFNLHQIDKKNLSPWKGFHDHEDGVNYNNVDVEKLEQASKHCSACEAKYRLILNTINPNRQKQKITDETIRKLLIQLKALFVARKFEEAEDLADTALEDGYRHADIYYMAGEVKRSLKLHREAEACYLQALTFQVHSPYIYQSLGLTYIDLDNHKRAVPLLKHFTDKIVSDSACFELGKCLAVCKNYLEATVYFGKAIEINPRVGDYYLHRGDSYEALGFMKLAIDDYRNFRKLVPEYQEVFISNIKSLEFQGRYDEANTYKAYLKKIEV